MARGGWQIIRHNKAGIKSMVLQGLTVSTTMNCINLLYALPFRGFVLRARILSTLKCLVHHLISTY